MNKGEIAKMRFKRVRVRPMARRIAPDGTELEPMDDCYLIQDASRDEITLRNTRTSHVFPVGTDHIREFLSDVTGGTDGFLNLKSQITLYAMDVTVEPLEQRR
jgi:hypothetical protein